jgi:hypothetical protein
VRPTLIQRPDGGDMVSHITAWVEPDTGCLRQAEVRRKAPSWAPGSRPWSVSSSRSTICWR